MSPFLTRLRTTLVVLAAVLAVSSMAALAANRLLDRGPGAFDPDRHLELISRLPGGGVGYPDLVSVSPEPLPVESITFAETELLVVKFDGVIMNAGPGPLDIYGDPQADASDPRSPHQRIWDGEQWTSLQRPPTRFESADGHNHFHLMQIARYSLWDLGESLEIAPSSKVGFCLIDSIQDDPQAEQGYFQDDGNYCRQGVPGARVLRMGIAGGFSDLYTSDVALQWIDVSDVTPGRYLVAAEIDPFDQIAEADETNNGLEFSQEATIVPGHVARSSVVRATGTTKFPLDSDRFGITGGLAFRVTAEPLHGTLQPPDPDAQPPTIAIYKPDPGFSGIDSFRFAAYDPTSAYPRTAVESVVLISVGEHTEAAMAIDGRRASVHTSSILPLGVVSVGLDTPPEIKWSVDGVVGGSPATGFIEIDGTYHAPADPLGTIVISATADSMSASIEVDVVTPPNHRPYIQAPIEYLPLADPDDSQEMILVTTIRKGTTVGFIVPATDPNGDTISFSAIGLPPGLDIDPHTGFVSGQAKSKGTFVVTYSAHDGTTTSSIEATLVVN